MHRWCLLCVFAESWRSRDDGGKRVVCNICYQLQYRQCKEYWAQGFCLKENRPLNKVNEEKNLKKSWDVTLSRFQMFEGKYASSIACHSTICPLFSCECNSLPFFNEAIVPRKRFNLSPRSTNIQQSNTKYKARCRMVGRTKTEPLLSLVNKQCWDNGNAWMCTFRIDFLFDQVKSGWIALPETDIAPENMPPQ